ncbi:hypothetical protein EVAR_18858_1 [Eumeta japonica]|uniref:Uncharacterized protein n=1 Tax=Eumeta variegata TaxID=151549 RepID=A0A4C1ULR4_EUMVA|nr:hypothetical protein EVAR_18858_1 [Eumeta japonica]
MSRFTINTPDKEKEFSCGEKLRLCVIVHRSAKYRRVRARRRDAAPASAIRQKMLSAVCLASTWSQRRRLRRHLQYNWTSKLRRSRQIPNTSASLARRPRAAPAPRPAARSLFILSTLSLPLRGQIPSAGAPPHDECFRGRAAFIFSGMALLWSAPRARTGSRKHECPTSLSGTASLNEEETSSRQRRACVHGSINWH